MVQSDGGEHAGPLLVDRADVAARRAHAPPHRHTGNEEAYFVLDGVIEFRIDDAVFDGTDGTFVLVPAGGAHTFGNTIDAPARLLVLHAPALDGYFAELEQLWAEPAPPERDTESALMRRHGMEPA